MASRITLLALHGYTLNGAQMRAALGPLAESLSEYVELVYPDGPHVCEAASVDRLYALTKAPRLPGPHLSWWDATDDGRVYRGIENTLEQMRELLERHQPCALVGFSQGGILTAILAALSSRGEMPTVAFAVLVAGSLPRAESLLPLFETPVSVPSLHVWGERDSFSTSRAPQLAQSFDVAKRETVRWPGPHVIPTRGEAAASIVDFVRRNCSA